MNRESDAKKEKKDDKKLKEVHEELINTFLQYISKFLNIFNINESIAKIWIVLLTSEKPLTQKEIAEKTGFSLSLISPALRTLERLSLIERTTKSGKNKKYVASKTISEALVMMLLQYKNTQIQALEEKIKEISKTHEINEEIQKELQKIKEETTSLLNLISKLTKSK